MLELMDGVKIKKSGVKGVIVDIMRLNGVKWFAVQSDKPTVSGGTLFYPIYDCKESELIKDG